MPPRLEIGDAVRVKDGVMDPDYEDQCIGGWTGVIVEIDDSVEPPLLLVAWDEDTLTDLIGEAVLERAERHGLEGDSIWLDMMEVERADLAQGSQIPQPARLDAQLRADLEAFDAEAAERIADVFGLSAAEDIPEVTEASLAAYHQHLSTHLRFPFMVEYIEDAETLEETSWTLLLTALAALDECDVIDGLLCEGRREPNLVLVPLAEIDVEEDTPNAQFITDYQKWFWEEF
jgi:hypothetical protein